MNYRWAMFNSYGMPIHQRADDFAAVATPQAVRKSALDTVRVLVSDSKLIM